jgi:hypothetical protein
VQTSVGSAVGARDWEFENELRSSKGEITDAELGLLNLKNAMRDPALLKEMAEGLRQSEGRAELIKMMANPKFQEQSKRLADNMRANGVFAAFLEPEFYAKKGGCFEIIANSSACDESSSCNSRQCCADAVQDWER